VGVAQRIRGRWRLATLAVLCVTLLLTSLDTTILNVALPSIVRSLHATSSELQWIVDAYAVVFAGLLLTLGALGDRIGRKWVFMAGLVVFGTGSALAAFSDTPDRLTAARAVMGVGAAALMPCTLSILTNTFAAERERAAAIGIWSGTAGPGVAIAPIAAVLLVAAPSSVWLVRRVGTKLVVAGGMALIAIGAGVLAGTSVHDGYARAVPAFALIGLGVGLALAPSTESIMGSLPRQEAGVGSATSDTSMQLGGALGVAVLGTALNIRFRDTVGPLLAHRQVPPSIASLVEGSLGGALAVAARIPGRGGQLLEAAARHGFISGIDLGFTVAAIVVAAAACVVLALLPSRPRPPAADGDDRGAVEEAPSGVPVETTRLSAGPGG